MTKALLLVAMLCNIGCSPALLQTGKIYYIAWSGAEPDVVRIVGTRGDGWYDCESIVQQGSGVWACSLNTAVYFVEVKPRPAPVTERAAQ